MLLYFGYDKTHAMPRIWCPFASRWRQQHELILKFRIIGNLGHNSWE